LGSKGEILDRDCIIRLRIVAVIIQSHFNFSETTIGLDVWTAYMYRLACAAALFNCLQPFNE